MEPRAESEAGPRKASRGLVGLGCVVAALAAGGIGCGDEDFEDQPRPPVQVELTGVIQGDRVTISPDRVGAGPILITISNQTNAAHTVTLQGAPRAGERVRERVGPINPLDTATIQKTLKPGSYEVLARSRVALAGGIRPARLTVGRERADSSDRVLLP